MSPSHRVNATSMRTSFLLRSGQVRLLPLGQLNYYIAQLSRCPHNTRVYFGQGFAAGVGEAGDSQKKVYVFF